MTFWGWEMSTGLALSTRFFPPTWRGWGTSLDSHPSAALLWVLRQGLPCSLPELFPQPSQGENRPQRAVQGAPEGLGACA